VNNQLSKIRAINQRSANAASTATHATHEDAINFSATQWVRGNAAERNRADNQNSRIRAISNSNVHVSSVLDRGCFPTI
jgi:hypothetical protein